jgi:rSAM/selenodomain-associated transferase 2/rSAM/selenodomain-associated transferase 1
MAQLRGAEGCAKARSNSSPISTSKISSSAGGALVAAAKIFRAVLLTAVRRIFGRHRRSPQEYVIVFTRYPEPGKSKTRLIPELGSEGATRLHRVMTESTVAKLRRLRAHRSAIITVSFDGGSESLMKLWLGSDLSYRRQASGDLGERMHAAFDVAFCEGAKRVVLVGTDIPELSGQVVEQALTELERLDLVLCPTTDGGYCLIGLRRAYLELFTGIPWSSETVLADTLKIAQRLGLSTLLLDRFRDVDRPADLQHWERVGDTPTRSSARPSVTVIIPTLNEEDHLQATLAAVRAGGDSEIIVADGGSVDRTTAVAESEGVSIVFSSAGRSHQMNEGAKVASGQILLFLHADTLLPPDWKDQVIGAMALPEVVGGAFKLSIDSDLPGLRTVERLANFRSRRLGTPYGDQAIFVCKRAFDEIGGFPHMPILEDFELVRALRKRGNLCIVPSFVLTSARRWSERGVWKTTLVNQLMLVGHMLGSSPHDLSSVYRNTTTYRNLIKETCRVLVRLRFVRNALKR